MVKRLVVTGSRLHRCDPVPMYPATDHIIVAALIEAGQQLGRDTVLVHGDQGDEEHRSGADRIAARWWRRWGLPTEEHPADWDGPCAADCKPGHRLPNIGRPGTYCPQAGPRRNRLMIGLGADLCLGLPYPGRGKTGGTWGCARLARQAGIGVWIRWDPAVAVPAALAAERLRQGAA